MNGERKVLVGTVFGTIGTTWHEYDGTIEEVVEKQRERWQEREPRHTGTEVIEVVVTRRFVVHADVQVVETGLGSGSQSAEGEG